MNAKPGRQITYRQELSDLHAAARFFEAHKKRHKVRRRWHPIAWLLIASVLGTPVLWGLQALRQPAFRAAWMAQDWSALLPYSVFAIPLAVFAGGWLIAPLLRGLALRESPALSQDTVLTVDEEGLHSQRTQASWSEVSAIEATTDHLFVLFRGNGVFTVPRRAFSCEFAFLQFADFCHDLWASATDSDSLPPRD